MIDEAQIVEATTAARRTGDGDDWSMRVLEWGLAAIALLAAVGLAFVR